MQNTIGYILDYNILMLLMLLTNSEPKSPIISIVYEITYKSVQQKVHRTNIAVFIKMYLSARIQYCG